MSNHRITEITVLIIIILSIALVGKLALAQQTEPPAVGAFFYGKAAVNGRNVPINSYVIAKIDNEKRGQIKVDKIGFYGEEKGDRKLGVSGSPSSSGKEIQFFVKLPQLKEIKATQTAEWESGTIRQLDLTFIGEEIPDNSTEEELVINSTKETYFFKALIAGRQVMISLDNPNIPIISLQVIVNKNLTNVTFEFETINIADLPKSIPKPEGVYKYLSINAPKVEQSYVQIAILKFKVPNGWFIQNSYDPTTVKLLRYYNNTWNQLVTYDEGSDAFDNYYRAVTPGFSYFAIKAEKLKQEPKALQLEASNKEETKHIEEKEPEKTIPQVTNQITTFVVEKVKTNPIVFAILVLVGVFIGILATYFFVVKKQE